MSGDGPLGETGTATASGAPSRLRFPAVPRAEGYDRRRLVWEVVLVLAVTLGRSALYSTLSLVRTAIETAQAGQSLADSSTSLNPAQDAEAFWDALYQTLDLVFAFCLVGLVVYLLWQPGRNALRDMGLDFSRFGRDLGAGLLLVVVIGIPGLGLYAAGRALGITVHVDASPLDAAWYTVPLLVLSALRAGLVEEVIGVGWLYDRLKRIGWSPLWILVFAAALRGLYHAYQGPGSIAGNAAMALVFGWVYLRWGRLMPLVIAHTVIDTIAFVGYPLAVALLPGTF